MQPYLLPYIGYFQLISYVDTFVVYDNIEFTKKGWINRNRFLNNGKEELFTLPIKKGRDSAKICERYLADDYNPEKILAKFSNAYRRSPYYYEVFPMLEKIFNAEEKNLFEFIYRSLIEINQFIGIQTRVCISSEIQIDHTLKGEKKVLAICKALKARNYVNPSGGRTLYNKETFEENRISLAFIESGLSEYRQFGDNFLPALSIVDFLMFNSREKTLDAVKNDYKVQ